MSINKLLKQISLVSWCYGNTECVYCQKGEFDVKDKKKSSTEAKSLRNYPRIEKVEITYPFEV